jgi:hypothetical protein
VGSRRPVRTGLSAGQRLQESTEADWADAPSETDSWRPPSRRGPGVARPIARTALFGRLSSAGQPRREYAGSG